MDTKNTSSTRRFPTNPLVWALLVAFLIAAVLTAYLTFIAVRDFVTSWEFTSLPGVALRAPTPTPDASGVITSPQQPLQPAGGPTPEPWDGASRVTVLVMGLDYRDWEADNGAPRTDTMMLLTIDPLARTAGMISIPRDMWVVIPDGFEYERINMAYRLGELYDYPNGGGPGLAMKTVEQFLGVPIDYYAQVDFGAFVRFIDEIGGVKVDITEKIQIDPMGDNNTKTLKPGRYTLPGDLALAYVRARKHAGDDFGRGQRQQEVIMAIRDRIVNAEILPTLIKKSPVLYRELSSGVNTNLTLEQAIQLAWLASQIPQENIRSGVIGPPKQVNLAKDTEGNDVLKPISAEIRILRDEIFADTSAGSPIAASVPLIERMKAEGARVSVLNGSSSAGLAAQTAEYLQAQGVNVVNTGNSDQLATVTSIYDYTGRPYTVQYLMELMSIQKTRFQSRYDPLSQVDVVIIVGTDWAANNTMGQ
jgi:LCP family protein required for cell wall assembly